MSSIPPVGGRTRPVVVFQDAIDARVDRGGSGLDEQGLDADDRGGAGWSPPAVRAHRAYARAVRAPGRRRPVACVGDLMTRGVVALPADGVVAEAAAVIRERGIRHVPVVDRDGHPIGVVAERDLLSPSDLRRDAPVSEVMARDLARARPEHDVRSAARRMLDRGVGSVVVVDADGVLVGLLTRRDIVRAVADGAPVELWA